jgi:hypothetical protein
MEGAEGTDSPGGAPDTFLPSGAPARFCLDGGVDTIREEVGYRPEYTNRAGNHGIHRLVARASGMKIVSGFYLFLCQF